MLRTGQSLLVISLIGKLIIGQKSHTKHANAAQLNKARVEMVEIKAYQLKVYFSRFHEFLEKGKTFIKGIVKIKILFSKVGNMEAFLQNDQIRFLVAKHFVSKNCSVLPILSHAIKMDHSTIILILKDIEERSPSY